MRVESLAVRAPPSLNWESEVALRMPERSFWRAGDEPLPRGRGTHGVVDIRQLDGHRWSLSLTLSDGRGFYRELDVDRRNPARELVSSLENLVAAIERGDVVADQKEATLAGDQAAAVAAPSSEAPAVDAARPPRTTAPAGPDVSPWLSGGALFGITPATNPVRGGGGALGLDLRFSRGLALRTGMRIIGLDGMTRIRWILGAGYTLRRARFELASVAFISLEAWRVRQGGGAVSLVEREPGHSHRPVDFVVDAQGDDVRTPLLGAGAAVEPRLRFETRRGPLHSLFLGLRIEGSVSGIPPLMAAFTVRRERGHAPVITAGGVEAAVAVTAGATFGRRQSKVKGSL